MKNNKLNRMHSTAFWTGGHVASTDADTSTCPVTPLVETGRDKKEGLGLKVRNLEITMEGKKHHPPLVHQVNLYLTPGRPLTLMGESGCGKSLIAQAIFHLLPEELSPAGEIYYGDRNLLACSQSTMRRLWGREIFLFPQEPGTALNPLRRSCSQVTEIFRWVRNGNNGNVFGHFSDIQHLWKTYFKQVGLSISDGKKYPWQLSGGMNQRLLTVMAMAEPARLIVADEPTKGLDPDTRDLTIGLLGQMVDFGKSLFVITHDVDVPRQLGGDLAVMYGGMIMESGPAAHILDAPAHPYTRALLRALPQNGLHPIPLQLNGNRFQGGCPFSPRCTEALPLCFCAEPAETMVSNEVSQEVSVEEKNEFYERTTPLHERNPFPAHGGKSARIIRCHQCC
ncbi:MAG: ABC transporter ATP-binding protein [Desulfobacterium sp.]